MIISDYNRNISKVIKAAKYYGVKVSVIEGEVLVNVNATTTQITYTINNILQKASALGYLI